MLLRSKSCDAWLLIELDLRLVPVAASAGAVREDASARVGCLGGGVGISGLV